MSSTTNIQNLLVNVFRPVYTYDPLTTLFTPKLELSNIDTYSGNTITVFNAAIGDSAFNVYVGSNAGNPYTAIRNSSNNTAVGYNSGNLISNVSNCTYLGYNAGAGATPASNVIGIGADAGGAGISNIFLGNGTGSTGSNNILIGHGIAAGTSNNLFRIGSTVYGDLSNNWIGIGRSTPYDSNDKLDVSGNVYVLGQVGINITPGGRTLDVNGDFRASDASGNVLDFNNGLTLSSGGLGSLRGSVTVGNTSNVSIGTLKNGLAMVAVSSGATNFDGRTSFVLDPSTPIVSNLSSNKSATTEVNFTSDSINISNTTGGSLVYSYSITYFPLP
jgi:hypothetical protein